MSKFVDLTGRRFGRLTVIKRKKTDDTNRTYWICQCDCGNTKTVEAYALKIGRTKSCGCLSVDIARQKAIRHGLRHLSEFWNGQKNIILLDPNMFACTEWKNLSEQLINSRAYIDFSQGCDIRIMTDEKANYITFESVRKFEDYTG